MGRTTTWLQSEIRAIAGRVAARARSHERLGAQAIHEMRKELKRARGALRLLRDGLSEKEYRIENALLRDAARPLGAARDATVLLEVTKELSTTQAGRRNGERLAKLREVLRAESASLGERMQTPQTRKAVTGPLERALAHIARWRLPRDIRGVAAGGLERLYRKAHKAAKAARKEPSDEALHEARKQAKYLANALSLLAPGKKAAKAARSAADLASKLGDDHDLAVLLGRLGKTGDAAEVRAQVQRRRRKLQRKAWKRARKAYRLKPKRFAAGAQRKAAVEENASKRARK